jgi:Zn-dependent membrane protease YugP
MLFKKKKKKGTFEKYFNMRTVKGNGERDVHCCPLESAGTSDTTIKVSNNPGKKKKEKKRQSLRLVSCNFLQKCPGLTRSRK